MIRLIVFLFLLSPALIAQPETNEPDSQTTTAETNEEVSNNEKAGLLFEEKSLPLVEDGAYEFVTRFERTALPLPHIREADVAWSKRIWRVIDTRQKMNLPFVSDQGNFIEVLLKIAQENPDLPLFQDDGFTQLATREHVANRLSVVDSVEVYDMEKEEYIWQATNNVVDYKDFNQIRLKEDWMLNTNTGRMECRIIGIALVREVSDPESGVARGNEVLFWMHYPTVRDLLAKERVWNPYNDAVSLSWQQLLDMRIFASYITKESNPLNKRLIDVYSEEGAILAGQQIKAELFQKEMDLWSY